MTQKQKPRPGSAEDMKKRKAQIDKERARRRERIERMVKANDLIRAIADRGRRFFYSPTGYGYAYFRLNEKQRLYFHDDGTGEFLSCHVAWMNKRLFSHGGTMNGLVRALSKYVMFGTYLSRGYLGPWHSWVGGGDLWDYGEEAMGEIRQIALDLGICEDLTKTEKGE